MRPLLIFLAVAAARRIRIDSPQPLLLTEEAVAAGGELVSDSSFDVLWLSEAVEINEHLRPDQLVPHLPGLAAITRKHHLASGARVMNWSNTPATFSSAADAPAGSPPFTWLSKSVMHRGVVPIPNIERARQIASGAEPSEIMQARVAEPLLIDGTEFDVGVYVVAVEQPDGTLGYSFFDDLLLRFCVAPSINAAQAAMLYEKDPDGAAPALHDAWIVDDHYRSTWQMASLQPLLSNGSAATALARVLRSRNLDGNRTWTRMQDAVAHALAVVASGGGGGVGEARHYDLMRFDFKLDVRGKPWLLEVNSNPNLVPTSSEQAAVLRRLCRFLWDKTAPRTPQSHMVPQTRVPSALRRILTSVRAMRSRALTHEPWHTATATACGANGVDYSYSESTTSTTRTIETNHCPNHRTSQNRTHKQTSSDEMRSLPVHAQPTCCLDAVCSQPTSPSIRTRRWGGLLHIRSQPGLNTETPGSSPSRP